MTQVRQQFNSQELSIVLSHYDLGAVQDVREFARGSHAAAKVVVTTDRGRYLLKRRPKGRDDPFRVAFAHSLQNFLASKNFPLPHLIGTRGDNNSMLKIGESLYEAFEFIEGVPYDGGLVATYEAGRTLGLYHQIVKSFLSEYKPPQGHYHDSQVVIDSFPQMVQVLARAPTVVGHEAELKQVLIDLRAAYKDAAEKVNDLGISSWETQIVHSDWHPGNMIFDRGHVVAVIDFDAARIRQRVLDISNGCLQFSMIAGGRDLTTWEAKADVLRAKRFLRGYDEQNVVTHAELNSVPLLMLEALIAQAVSPIVRTGTFAGLDGFGFLKVMLKKVVWLQENRELLKLDDEES